jgi:hypothetical protein
MLNLNLNILGASNKPIVPIQPAPQPTTTTTTTSTTSTTTSGPGTVRTDVYSASLELALPGAMFTSLGMTAYNEDISQVIRGTGTGYGIQPTSQTGIGAIVESTTSPTPKWSSEGYPSSMKSQAFSYVVSGQATDSYNNLNSSSFTIETWVSSTNWSSAAGATEVYRAYAGGPLLFTLQSIPNLGQRPQIETILINTAGTEFVYVAEPYTLQPDNWYHTAVVRSGSAYNMLLNGEVVLNFLNAATLKNSQAPTIMGSTFGGAQTNLSSSFQDFRLYKGIAKYPNQISGSTYTTPQSMVIA